MVKNLQEDKLLWRNRIVVFSNCNNRAVTTELIGCHYHSVSSCSFKENKKKPTVHIFSIAFFKSDAATFCLYIILHSL